MISLSQRQVSLLRLRAQRLILPATHDADSVERVVKDLFALQAQDLPASMLSVRVRSIGLVAADVDHARLQERSIVRTWGIRGTLHLLPSDDLAWLLALIGPGFIAANRSRRAELGLDDDTCSRGVRIICHALATQGSLTKAELVAHLAGHGINAEGQAVVHLVYYAALQGLVCLGPERKGKTAYVLLSDWLGALPPVTLSREQLCVELALRYLAAYGPAGPEDFAAWSGISLKEVRAAWPYLTRDCVELEVEERPAWLHSKQMVWLEELADPSTASAVHLLPAFDTYLLGYRSRDLVVAPEFARRVHPGGGMLQPVVLVDGRAAGTWKVVRKRDHLEVVVEPFERIDPATIAGLEVEASDVGQFLGTEAVLRLEDPHQQ